MDSRRILNDVIKEKFVAKHFYCFAADLNRTGVVRNFWLVFR